ncbi:MAG TPA: ATP-binding protein [Phycisphaerae bacterium]|nr:ATP-binding protein [Phycisphaerae bacterium]
METEVSDKVRGGGGSERAADDRPATQPAVDPDLSGASDGILRGFYESIACMMGVVEMRGEDIVILSCNPATASAYGATPDQLSGRSVRELGVAAENLNFWRERYHAALLARQPVTFEFRHQSAARPEGADATARWYRATVCPILRLSPHPQFCFFAEDITRQKAAEEELRGTKDAAEAANRAKSEFLANMSHEIRTPMTAILGYADVLLDAAADDRERAVAAIRRNGQHLMGILNDILDLSKVEAGRLGVALEPVNLFEVLADVATALRPRAALKGVRFSLETLPGLPDRIRTDPTRLRQILLNLVGNAVKFTQEGSVHVTAGADGPLVRIRVQDTGPGIDHQTLAALFQPFVQADASATRRHGGAGLGLAISQRLAQLLGGAIACSTEPDAGSTFTLTLPMVSPGELPAAGAAPVSPAPTLAGHVLLVDDSADTRALIAHFLTRAGLRITTAADGRQACDLAFAPATPALDLVLMDMQMPVMDGYAAARELRRRGARYPIVALTANAMRDDENRCLAAGCSGYLSKPVERHSLIEAVARWLHPQA